MTWGYPYDLGHLHGKVDDLHKFSMAIPEGKVNNARKSRRWPTGHGDGMDTTPKTHLIAPQSEALIGWDEESIMK